MFEIDVKNVTDEEEEKEEHSSGLGFWLTLVDLSAKFCCSFLIVCTSCVRLVCK